MKKQSLGFLAIAFMLLSAFAWPWSKEAITIEDGQPVYNGKPAKYTFLFIGDGMALPQINAAEAYVSALEADGINPVKLNLTQLPSQGLTTTYSHNAFITDSAAAATALATGKKTNSGVIAMDPEKKIAYKTIAEMAKEKGLKVGIVSSVSIDHATPASFFAHEPTRKNYYEISAQMADSGFDYFAGGGMKGNSVKKRKDRPDLTAELSDAGYTITDNRADFLKLQAMDGQKVVAYDKFIDVDYALTYEIDRPEKSISLAEFTAKGIELLKGDEGFFMMVEGGKIDWACHANDAGATIQDTLAFDEAVGVALDFYSKHPSDTAIIVTGDHETGGMTLGFAGTKYGSFYDKIRYQSMSYQGFDEKFAEYKASAKSPKLSDIYEEIEAAFGLVVLDANERADLQKLAEQDIAAAKATLAMALTDKELNQLKAAFKRSISGQESDDDYMLYGGYEPVSVTLTHLLNNKAGIAWTTYSHTGVPVATFATGLGHKMFNGYYDNTDIFSRIAQIMNVQ